ncbi:MAG: hypothetical protein ACO23C_00670 [Prochlorococcaceae cyanobacterium]
MVFGVKNCLKLAAGLILLAVFAAPAEAQTQQSNQPHSARSSGIAAVYASKAEAEAAARHFGCRGAHKMGHQWMPCGSHRAATSQHQH